MGEIAAHEPAGLAAVLGAGFVVEVGDLLQPAELIAAANGATISPQPSRAASSIEGFENDAT